MNAGRGIALFIILVFGALLVPTVARADTNPPSIEAVWWEPRYPIHPENITIYARVSDADGLSLVESTFCYLPPFLCLYDSMTDPEGDGVFSVVPMGPGSTSTQAMAEGASIGVSAQDTAGNSNLSSKQYMLFVDSLNLTFERTVFDVEPGGAFTVNGTALYEDNATAPAEGIPVNVTVASGAATSVVDANGSFSATFTAPLTEGTYTITAIASYRSLTDSEEATLAVSTVPRADLTISNIEISPTVPVEGRVTISFHAKNVGTAAVSDAHILVQLVGSPSVTLLDQRHPIPALGGDIQLVAMWTANVGSYALRISIDPDGEFDELNEANNVIDYPVSVQALPPPEIPVYVWVGAAGVGVGLLLLAAAIVMRRRHVTLSPRIIAIVSVAIAGVLVGAGVYAIVTSQPPAPRPAAAFAVTDIDGNALNSTGLLGDVVLLDFSGTWCEPCKIVENAFKEIFPSYSTRVVFLSVFIPPLNDQISLEAHRQDRGIPAGWHIAPDSDQMNTKFAVSSLPRLFILNRAGYVTLDWQPSAYTGLSVAVVKNAVTPVLDRTIAGQASTINVASLGIPALMVLAAFLSFFSPCSFPVLPAFMAYYLNLDAKGTKAGARVAAGRGFLASLGMVSVYGVIAIIVFTAGLAARNLQYISPIIGVILIVAAVLSLLPFQYHYLTKPFIALKKAIAARLGGKWKPGMGARLFAFGAGYAAAGFACVAPPLIGAMSAASAVGQPGEAAVGLLLYIFIVIGLMMAVTVALTVAGDRAIKKVRVWSGIMKYVSAVALLIAGGYLLWLFYVSTVAG
jgi:cytochrome c-type biogenesis protein